MIAITAAPSRTGLVKLLGRLGMSGSLRKLLGRRNTYQSWTPDGVQKRSQPQAAKLYPVLNDRHASVATADSSVPDRETVGQLPETPGNSPKRLTTRTPIQMVASPRNHLELTGQKRIGLTRLFHRHTSITRLVPRASTVRHFVRRCQDRNSSVLEP